MVDRYPRGRTGGRRDANGAFTFTVTAVDAAGNQRQVTRTYRVRTDDDRGDR
jgi:hypothetical protein